MFQSKGLAIFWYFKLKFLNIIDAYNLDQRRFYFFWWKYDLKHII